MPSFQNRYIKCLNPLNFGVLRQSPVWSASHSSAYRLVLRIKNNIRKTPLYSNRLVISNKLLSNISLIALWHPFATLHYHNYSSNSTLRIQINHTSHLQKYTNKAEMKRHVLKYALQRFKLISSIWTSGFSLLNPWRPEDLKP